MRKFLIVIFCIVFFTASSQVSGYMGKKFSIIYSPGVGFPQTEALSSFKVKVPTIHNALKLEYIISKHIALGLRYKFGYNTQKNDSDFNVFEGFVERHVFMSHTYGAFVKFYRKKKLAPLGRYFSLGVNFQNLSLNNLILEDLSLGQNSASKANYGGFDVGLSAAVGNNWLVGNSLLLGFEFEFMPTLLSLRNVVEGSVNRNLNTASNTRINSINLSAEILKLSLNIGFLAF